MQKTSNIDWNALLQDAMLSALISLILLFPLAGFEAVSDGGSLSLVAHAHSVLCAVILIFCGRLGLRLIDHGLGSIVLAFAALMLVFSFSIQFPTQFLFTASILVSLVLAVRAIYVQPFVKNLTQSFSPNLKNTDKIFQYIGYALIACALILPFLPFADRRLMDVAILILTYLMLGWGLSIVVGMAGLLDLGYVAFYAIGSYSYALLSFYLGLSFWICLPLAGLFAAVAGLLLGQPVLRLRGDYFAIVTLGFGEITRIILINWQSFTRGPDGISGIPRPSLMGVELDSMNRIIFLYYLILILALVVCWITRRLRSLPIGRAWEALRENEIAAQSLGINQTNVKLAAYMLSAVFGGLAGAFFAARQGFISPESFTLIESIIILAIVVMGGMGNALGIVFATFLLIGLPEIFRELEQYRMVAFGAGLVAIMIWRPQGLMAKRKPTILLNERTAE
jgi:branched-chain amino acid transport system permease protein